MKKQILLLCTLSLLQACQGKAPPTAKATRQSVTVDSLELFPIEGLKSLTFSDTKLFFWKNDVDSIADENQRIEIKANRISSVLKISKALDQLDNTAWFLKIDQSTLQAQLNEKIAKIDLLKSQIESSLKERDTAKNSLDEELKKSEAEQNKDTIQNLKKQIEGIDSALVTLAAAQADVQSKLDELQIQKNEIDHKLETISDQYNTTAQELDKNVDMFVRSPENITFDYNPETVDKYKTKWQTSLTDELKKPKENQDQFLIEKLQRNLKVDRETPIVQITGWDPDWQNNNGKSFSVKQASIGNVSYEPVGGKIHFEVFVSANETFTFDLLRFRYNDISGRNFMTGEIKYEKRKVDETGKLLSTETRTGSVKLVDRNN